MKTTHPKQIKTNTIILFVIVYTFITNFNDVKKGLVNGWMAIETHTEK